MYIFIKIPDQRNRQAMTPWRKLVLTKLPKLLSDCHFTLNLLDFEMTRRKCVDSPSILNPVFLNHGRQTSIPVSKIRTLNRRRNSADCTRSSASNKYGSGQHKICRHCNNNKNKQNGVHVQCLCWTEIKSKWKIQSVFFYFRR